MPEIKLEHITKRWGKFYGVDDLNLVIENNAFVTLLATSFFVVWKERNAAARIITISRIDA